MTRDAGYDDFLDAVEDGEPYCLAGVDGRTHLPPMPRDPATGEAGMERRALPETGEILTHTTTHIPGPAFDEDAPYVTAVASFGPVNVTGQVRGVDPAGVEIGQPVSMAVTHTETTGERVLVFDPV